MHTANNIYICIRKHLKGMTMFRIKEVIKEKGMTISQVAELIETTQPHLSNLINNKATPSLEMLQRIADALGVHISELFDRPEDNVFRCPKCGATLEIREKI